ncbi:unnamed protein product [Peronospora destructor]|uniref:Uncharacterized protein n=1 Tax=Peronospora destructor TaxID=86335 RepID=A0AAV0VE45_9STRA|nr:unnamed protein product [Peronospora destructor]
MYTTLNPNQPIQNLTVLHKATEDFSVEQRAAKKQQWGRYWIERGFQALKTSSVKAVEIYCFGDNVAAAASLQCQTFQYGYTKIAKHPTIARFSAGLKALSAFKRAHRSQQPDAVD